MSPATSPAGLLSVAARAATRSGGRCTQALRFASTEAAASSSSAPRAAGLTLRGAVSTLTLGATFYALGAFYPPEVVSLAFPRPAPPPLHPHSPEGILQVAQVEDDLQTLPEIVALRQQEEKYYEARPHVGVPEEKQVNSLTAGALRGPGKIAVPPILFAAHDDSETVAFLHLGRGMCGHDGIVHGGLIATLLDESLARTAVINLPSKVGVTAKLEINYRTPTKANQIVCIRTSLIEKKGRKVFVKGQVEDLQGTVLAEANALFIEPRHAHLLKASWMESALGKRIVRSKENIPVPQDAAV